MENDAPVAGRDATTANSEKVKLDIASGGLEPAAAGQCNALSGREERADGHVISVGVPERELLGLSVRIYVWLLFQASDERACPLKGLVEIVDTEEQQETVAGGAAIGAHQ